MNIFLLQILQYTVFWPNVDLLQKKNVRISCVCVCVHMVMHIISLLLCQFLYIEYMKADTKYSIKNDSATT